MPMNATYSHEDNKLRLYSVERLDALNYGRACKLRFRYATRQELFVAPAWTPEREDFLIELCGEVRNEESRLKSRSSGALVHAVQKTSRDERVSRIMSIEADARKITRSLVELEKAIAALSVEGLTYEQAMEVTTLNVSYCLMAALRDAPANYKLTCEKYVEALKRNRDGYYSRWASHYDSRLKYERRMLADQSGVSSEKFYIGVGGEVFLTDSKEAKKPLVAKIEETEAQRVIQVMAREKEGGRCC